MLDWDCELFIAVCSSSKIGQNKYEFFCNICWLTAFDFVVFKGFGVFFERPNLKLSF